ncbi:MAG: YhdP family protein [Moraxellaceae bacterium]
MNWQTFRLRALWCWHQLLTLALLALVLVAVVVGVGRQFLPELDQYRPRLEAELSTRMGLPVRLARLEGAWEGLGLKLQLHDLQLRDPVKTDTTLLRIPEVELRPALWQSLWHREPRVDVRLSGLDIHFDQLADGSLKLRELAGLAGTRPEAAEQALRFALRQPVLALSASRIGLALQNKPEVNFSDIDLVSVNAGDRHQLAGRLLVAGKPDALDLQLDLKGDPLRWQQSDLRVWMHLPVVALERWLPVPDANARGLRSLTGGGDYWLHFRRGVLSSVQAKLDWRDVVVDDGQRRHHLQNMVGQLAWSQDAAGWQLAATGLKGRADNAAWPVPELALRQQAGHLDIGAGHIDVAAAALLLGGFPLPEKLAVWLREAAPQGRVPSLRAGLQQDAQGRWQPQWLDARVAALDTHASAAYPGVSGLAAWLRWTPETTWLGLETRDAEVNLPQLFRERVAVKELRGHLRLQHRAALWQLDSDQLQLSNPDAQASALFSLAIPADDPAAARLSLLAGIQEARAASTWRYVPWTVAGDDTLAWLRRSILGGKVSQGDFLYEGPLHNRDDLGPHRMLMRFALSDGRLDYDSHWPELKRLNAEVTLDGGRLSISSPSVRLLDASSGQKLSAEIADLHKPVLQLQGEVSSTGADLMRLFRESALKQHTGGLAEAVDLDGPLQGQLRLAIPLQGSAAPEVEVQAELPGNRLRLRQAGLEVSGLQGGLSYSSRSGLTAESLKARLLEAPVSASISSQVKRGNLAEINVNLAGQIGIPALRRWLGSSLLDMASGSTAYQARITVPADATPVRLQFNSSLVGLRLDLPPPFGKTAAQSAPLQYQTSLGSGERMARLQYGAHLAAGLVWEGSRLDRVLLRLSGSSPAWPQNPGIEVEGSLARLDLDSWMPWIQRLNRGSAATAAARGESPLPALSRLNLQVGELLAEGLRLQNAQIGLNRDGAAWKVVLDSEAAAGQLLLPDAPAAELKLSFSHLQWPLPGSNATAAAPEAPGALPGLGNRPLLIDGEGLKLASWPGLGLMGVSARLLPSPYGMRIEDIVFDSSVLDFKGRLDWQWRGGVSTRLRGTASSNDMAGLLSAAGYAPSLVSPKSSADLDLAWPGSPEKPVLSGLDGRLTLTVEHGRLLNISNTTSASRVFGWFDVDNIKRRFKGDFSDVMKRGLSFDKASLSGTIQSGVMAQSDFLVDGPTLKAKGNGVLDLGRQQMDQQFTVIVPVSSAVPVAAVVVAGPLIGGAVAAAQLAFESQLDKVTQLRYHVSGNWADPKVERINMRTPQGKAGKPASGAVLPVADSKGSKP